MQIKHGWKQILFRNRCMSKCLMGNVMNIKENLEKLFSFIFQAK